MSRRPFLGETPTALRRLECLAADLVSQMYAEHMPRAAILLVRFLPLDQTISGLI